MAERWPVDEFGRPVPPEDAVAFSLPRGRRLVEYVAVLEAVGMQVGRRQEANGQWVVVVDLADAAEALEQLTAYEREQESWPPQDPDPLPPLKANSGSLGVGIGLALLFFYLGAGDAMAPAYVAGVADSRLIFAGDWHRCVTALTLHADFGHLAANCTFGMLFGAMLARRFGGGWSWLLILVAGGLGNLLNAAWMGPEHRSIGASTAVFAAVGLLTGVRARRLLQGVGTRRAVWVPLLAAIAFYFFSGNDPETDQGAHMCGLAVGLLLGLVLPRQLPVQRFGLAAGGLALAILAGSWWLAAN